VGLDHRPIEMEVEVMGVVVKKEEDRRGIVDWERLETGIRLEGEKEEWSEREEEVLGGEWIWRVWWNGLRGG